MDIDKERRAHIDKLKKFITVHRKEFKQMFPNRSMDVGDEIIRKNLIDLPDAYVVNHPCPEVGCLEVDVDQAFAELAYKSWITPGNIAAAAGYTMLGLLGISVVMGGSRGTAGIGAMPKYKLRVIWNGYAWEVQEKSEYSDRWTRRSEHASEKAAKKSAGIGAMPRSREIKLRWWEDTIRPSIRSRHKRQARHRKEASRYRKLANDAMRNNDMALWAKYNDYAVQEQDKADDLSGLSGKKYCSKGKQCRGNDPTARWDPKRQLFRVNWGNNVIDYKTRKEWFALKRMLENRRLRRIRAMKSGLIKKKL